MFALGGEECLALVGPGWGGALQVMPKILLARLQSVPVKRGDLWPTL